MKISIFLDTVHLNRSAAAAISRVAIDIKFSSTTKSTFKLRHQTKNRLADSIAWRAESEVRESQRLYNMDFDSSAATVRAAITTIV